MTNNQTIKKIVKCPRCNGAGYLRYFTDDPRYEGPGYVICDFCGGTGRMLKVMNVHYDTIFADSPCLTLLNY